MAAVLMACILIGSFASSGAAATAYAEEAEGGNAVNPQQLPDSSFIYDTSIADLSEADAYYDNQPCK